MYRALLDLGELEKVAERVGRPATSNSISTKQSPDRTLVAEFSPAENGSAAHRAASVTEVYPSAAVLPENLLRFYIQFSAPMSRGEAYRRIKLLDAGGKPVDGRFSRAG